MFNFSMITGSAMPSASFGLEQRVGTGPFSFLFDPTLLSVWLAQASLVYSGLVLAVMAAAVLACRAEKRLVVAV